ncbi:MAG: ParA family protein [Phycisphaeraceae bacterium]
MTRASDQQLQPGSTLDAAPTDTTPAAPPSPAPEPASSATGEPRLIALLNQKGGVGKTTTAVSVGAALARTGQRVLMVDLDPQAHLTLSLGLEPSELNKSIYHLLVERETSAAQIVQQIADNVGVLPAEVNLAGVEGELADRIATGAAQTILRNKCADLVRQFDYVIIDCPPSLGLLTVNALTLAKEVIVPMQAHFLALQGLSKLLETVQMVREGINDKLVVSGIVLCMHESQTILASEVAGDLRSFLEEARGSDEPWSEAILFEPPIRRNIKLAESPSFGQPIFDYAPESHGAADYAKLAASIAAHRVAK